MLKSFSLLFAGNIALAIFNLARNILLARLLPVEEFGIATTFNILLTAMTMVFGLGLGQFLIQAKDGDAARFQGALQTIQIGMGVVVGGVMFLCAGLYADLMTVPEVTWGFQVMALLALSHGLFHFDIYRLQREMHFLPLVLVTTAGVVISTLAVWPLYQIFGDYRVMLYTLVLQQLIAVAISHLMARRPYRLAWDRDVMRAALLFGAPLLINGLFLFGVMNGERLIVANRFGLEELAWFSVGFMLTAMPVNLLLKTLQSFFLPVLSRHRDKPVAFGSAAITTCEATLLAGLALALGFATLGPAVIMLLYGEKYLPAVGIVVLLAVMQGLRTAHGGPVVAALARARSELALYITLTRFAFIPLALALVVYGEISILTLVTVGIVGEASALALALTMMRLRLRVPLGPLVPPLGVAALVLATIVWQTFTRPAVGDLWLGLDPVRLLPAVFLAILAPLAFRNIRRELVERIKTARRTPRRP
ncbi:MAG: oligosaccharide flippase family protein [Pseudomonadota bacterium]